MSGGAGPQTGVHDGGGLLVRVVTARLGGVFDEGLMALLNAEPAIHVIAGRLDLHQLEARVATDQPDVAVLGDAQIGAPSVFARLRAARPGLGVMVISHGLSTQRGTWLLSCGVNACVYQEAPAEQIVAALKVAAEGGCMLVAGPGDRDDGRVSSLTPREWEVLRLLQAGDTNAEVAHKLDISQETVRTHARHLYRKLGISGRRHLRALELPGRD